MPEMQNLYFLVDTSEGDADNVVPMTANDMYPGDFPGYVGVSYDNLASDSFTPRFLSASNPADAMGGKIDYDSHGESGLVNANSYSIGGPVEPNQVENFELYGSVAAGQRRPEYGDGPVGAYDHGVYTSLQIAQQMNEMSYAEQSIESLLMGGV